MDSQQYNSNNNVATNNSYQHNYTEEIHDSIIMVKDIPNINVNNYPIVNSDEISFFNDTSLNNNNINLNNNNNSSNNNSYNYNNNNNNNNHMNQQQQQHNLFNNNNNHNNNHNNNNNHLTQQSFQQQMESGVINEPLLLSYIQQQLTCGNLVFKNNANTNLNGNHQEYNQSMVPHSPLLQPTNIYSAVPHSPQLPQVESSTNGGNNNITTSTTTTNQVRSNSFGNSNNNNFIQDLTQNPIIQYNNNNNNTMNNTNNNINMNNSNNSLNNSNNIINSSSNLILPAIHQFSEPPTPNNDYVSSPMQYQPPVRQQQQQQQIRLPQQQIIQQQQIQQAQQIIQQQQQLQQQAAQQSVIVPQPQPQTFNNVTVNINNFGPKVDIVDTFSQPFPIYTVKTHVLVPAPVVRVSGYKGDANDLMIVANPEPDDSIIISQPAVTCIDGTFEFKFADMHVDRKKHDPCSSFRLKFSLINKRTFERFNEVVSQPINLFYHTDLLPAPDIARLVPNSCYCGQEPEVTCYGYYFKKGRTEILYVDLDPLEPSLDHQPYSVKQEQLRMPNQTSFSFAFVPPNRSTPGTYNVSTRYTKNTTKKDKDKTVKNKSKIGKPHLFSYNELPEDGNPKRQRSQNVDFGDRNPSSPSSEDYSTNIYNGNLGSTNNNLYMVGSSSLPNSSPSYNNYMNCAIHGEVEELEDLLTGDDKYEYINTVRDSQGNTLVMIAAKEGRVDMVEKLIELGADLLIKNKSSHTVFHMACYSGSIELFDLIAEAVNEECNIISADSVGATCLHIATERGHYRLVKYICQQYDVLVECKDNRGLTAFHYAVQDGNTRITSIFIEHFLFMGDGLLNIKDHTGMTPLHWAAALGRYNIFVKLVEAGADINAIDGDGESPIFKSIVTNNKDINIYLIEKNCDVNIINNHGHSYIELLAEYSTELDSDDEDQEDDEEEQENENEKVSMFTQEEEQELKNALVQSTNSPSPSSTNKLELFHQFSKINLSSSGNNTTTTTTTASSSSTLLETKDASYKKSSSTILDKFEKYKSGGVSDFLTGGGELDLNSITSRDITVNRIQILVDQIERNINSKETEKNKQLTSLLQESFHDKIAAWMHSEEELEETKRSAVSLEEDLTAKASEIIKLNDFISACPVALNEIKAGSLGLFILKRERYYGFHSNEVLVIASNDSMSAIRKLYGNQLPSCLLANVVFAIKTQSTKPSTLMPNPGTEFYVVDLEVALQKDTSSQQ